MTRFMMLAIFITAFSCSFNKKGYEWRGSYKTSDYTQKELIPRDSVLFSGFVFSASSLEPIASSSVGLSEINKGTFTNDCGYFEIMLASKLKEIETVFNSTGYSTIRISNSNLKGGTEKRFIVYLGYSIIY